MISGPGLSLKAQIVIAVVSLALFLWVLPALVACIQHQITLRPAAVETSFALSVQCRLPTQHEQVTVLVRDAGGAQQRADCMYVRSRGAYGVAK
jgi:hypothetical protein